MRDKPVPEYPAIKLNGSNPPEKTAKNLLDFANQFKTISAVLIVDVSNLTSIGNEVKRVLNKIKSEFRSPDRDLIIIPGKHQSSFAGFKLSADRVTAKTEHLHGRYHF